MSKIESQRTELRRLEASDFDNMRLLESDPLIMKFTPSRIPQSEKQTRERLESQIAKQSGFAPLGIWAAELKDDRSFVGWFMLLPTDDQTLELGFMLVKNHWGNGLATEICAAIIDFGRTHFRNKRIMARTTVDNAPSMRVLEKLGFQYSETISAPDKVTGGRVELKLFMLPSP